MKHYLLIGASGLCLLVSSSVFAQVSTSTTVANPDGSATTTTETVKKDHGGTAAGAAGGAIAGAVVAGPIGAVVGGIAGATIGHTVAPPGGVKTYVTTQTTEPIAYQGDLAVGDRVDADIPWRTVPDYPKYSWARLNGERVVIDNDTHKIVAVY